MQTAAIAQWKFLIHVYWEQECEGWHLSSVSPYGGGRGRYGWAPPIIVHPLKMPPWQTIHQIKTRLISEAFHGTGTTPNRFFTKNPLDDNFCKGLFPIEMRLLIFTGKEQSFGSHTGTATAHYSTDKSKVIPWLCCIKASPPESTFRLTQHGCLHVRVG